jgi:hypothetical protein
MRIHPIFYIFLFELVLKSIQLQKRRIKIALDQEYEVEAILDERRKERNK